MERTNHISYFQLNYNILEHPSPWLGASEWKMSPCLQCYPPLPEKLGDIGSFNESNDGSDDERSEYRISSNSDDE